jgi:hypothetical protein
MLRVAAAVSSAIFLGVLCYPSTQHRMLAAAAQNPSISISSLSTEKTTPLSIITVVGAGFDPNSAVTVAFTARSKPKFQNLSLPKSFTLEMPVVSVTTTDVVVVAPFLTGQFLVQVVQRSDAMTVKSNSLKLTLKAAKHPSGTLGQSTLSGLAQALQGLEALQSNIVGTDLNDPTTNQALGGTIQIINTFKGQVEQAASGGNVPIGSVGGKPFVLDKAGVKILDQLVDATNTALNSVPSSVDPTNFAGQTGVGPSPQQISPQAAIWLGAILTYQASSALINGSKTSTALILGTAGLIEIYDAAVLAVDTLGGYLDLIIAGNGFTGSLCTQLQSGAVNVLNSVNSSISQLQKTNAVLIPGLNDALIQESSIANELVAQLKTNCPTPTPTPTTTPSPTPTATPTPTTTPTPTMTPTATPTPGFVGTFTGTATGVPPISGPFVVPFTITIFGGPSSFSDTWQWGPFPNGFVGGSSGSGSPTGSAIVLTDGGVELVLTLSGNTLTGYLADDPANCGGLPICPMHDAQGNCCTGGIPQAQLDATRTNM